MAYHRMYGIDTKIARIFNTYGPFLRPDDGRVISNFLAQAIDGARSPCTATVPRPARSVTSTTWSPGSWRCSSRPTSGR